MTLGRCPSSIFCSREKSLPKFVGPLNPQSITDEKHTFLTRKGSQVDESDTAYELPLGSRKTSLYTHSYLNFGQVRENFCRGTSLIRKLPPP